MSDLLSIGASGVRAYQSALATTSDNIANAGNTAYARRTTTLAEVSPAAGGLTSGRVIAPDGVIATGVGRSADVYQAAAVRGSAADLARTQTAASWLTQVQTALTGNDVGTQLTSFFDDAQTLAADPTSTAARSTLLQAGASAAGAFSATGQALAGVASDLDASAQGATQQLGTLGAALAKVNDALGRASPGSSGAASLADQRDSLTQQMSAISDVAVTTDAAGRATVRLGGATGPVLVDGINSGSVGYARNDDGAVAFSVTMGNDTSSLSPNGGALAGIADAAAGIAAAQEQLGDIASDFANGVNAVQAGGTDANGAAGAAMFTVGASPTDLSLAISDPAGIAASSSGEGTRGNGNLAALAQLRSAGEFESNTAALVSGNAAAIAAKTTVASAQSNIHDGAVSAQDATSGVNLDDEAVDLVRYQQAYSAASRVIQVARDTFQSILSIQ